MGHYLPPKLPVLLTSNWFGMPVVSPAFIGCNIIESLTEWLFTLPTSSPPATLVI